MTPCPICHSQSTTPLIQIDQLPLFCNLLWPSQKEARQTTRGDIHLTFCPNCGHLFNARFDPALMDYTEAYENSLHFSPRFQQYAHALATGLVERHQLYGKNIIGIGSGKGDFLQMLCELGNNRAIGFDPSYKGDGADNTAVSFVQAYYSQAYTHTPADFISCRHVLEHIEQPAHFMQMVRRVIGQRPIVTFFEVPNTLYTLQDLGIWDLIYEHCSYFTPASLTAVFQQNHFTVQRVDDTFNGQFLTIEATPTDHDTFSPTDLSQLSQTAANFSQQYQQKVTHWQNKLADLAQKQQRVVIWGAGSKGVTFLNILQTQATIQYAVDINPRKTGKFVAGTGQEIVTPHFLQSYQPHAIIIMNANYQQEIQQQLTHLGLQANILLA